MVIQESSNAFVVTTMQYRPRLVELLGKMHGAWYNGKERAWIVPKKHEQQLRKIAPWFGGEFVEGNSNRPIITDFTIPPMPELSEELEAELLTLLKIQPYQFQKQGIAYNLLHQQTINGMEMRLGKTLVSIATLALADYLHKKDPENNPPILPALVICPATLKLNWEAEIKKFSYLKPILLTDQVKNNFMNYYKHNIANVFIVNYESLQKYFVQEVNIPKGKKLALQYVTFKPLVEDIKCIITDESSRLKVFNTRQVKLTKGISARKKWIFALTGTPVVNTPADLAPQLGIINKFHHFAKNKAEFESHFCSGPKRASNLKELNLLLNKHCFYRFARKDVFKDLPPMMRQVISCEISTWEEYQKAEADLANYLREYRKATEDQIQKSLRGQIMVQMSVLKNISARGKLDAVREYIEEAHESNPDEKLVVFANLKEIIRRVHEMFPHAVTIVGDDSYDQRAKNMIKFRDSNACNIILCNFKTAKEGIRLDASNTTLFIEQDWTAATHSQCEARTVMPGKTDPLNYIYFIGENTIDKDIYEIIERKREVGNTIIGAEEEVAVEEKTITELMRTLTERLLK